MNQTRLSLLLVFLLSGALTAIYGQDFRAKVQGRVTDTSEAVVPGATVTLFNANTGVRTVKSTNEVGLYRFDYVDPGSYTVMIETSGFSRFVQENVAIRAQADITVDAVLKPGGVQETVTVDASPAAVEFNSTSMKTTVDTKLVEDIARLDRNPFKLSLLNPAVLETRRNEMNPFQSLSANSIDLGGSTSLKNDLLVDGSPISIGTKASYTPNTDAVLEVNVTQNSVDAEAGHSAGGVVNMTTKSGTNDWHGTAFYLGRNPALNAVSDRTTGSAISSKYNIWGGSVGNPILKGKLFNFASYEQWKQLQPSLVLRTVPTALERTGDFSKSLNINGGVRTIYDPSTTVLNPATGTVTRQPFANNVIPANLQDPLAAKLIGGIFMPNAVPDNITGTNNFKYQQYFNWNYWNLSDRADWYASEKWRVYGRVSRYHTIQNEIAPLMMQYDSFMPHGTARYTFALTGNVVYTVSSNTVVDFHAEYHTMRDDWSYPKYQQTPDSWSKWWPNNPWYKSYIQTDGQGIILPVISLGGSNFYGNWNSTMWLSHINGSSYGGKISHQRGSHFLKVGFDTRRTGGGSVTTPVTTFSFSPAMTANTYLNPNTRVVGDEFASFLTGAVAADSTMITAPVAYTQTELYSAFFQDDYKLNKRITLNLGLRYELEIPFHDPNHNESRFLDLTQANTVMQQTPPVLPASAVALRTAPPVYNGAWVYTDGGHPGVWNIQKTVFMPRIGVAIKITDKTALRIGFARFVIPTDLLTNVLAPTGATVPSVLAPPYPGFNTRQTPIDLIQGVPQQSFANPFPSGNPLISPPGKGFGPYLGLGDNVTFTNQNYQRGVNDRFNVTFSRQLPSQILAEVTYFANFGRHLAYVYNLNLMDPQIGYTNKTALDAAVANPFYQYLTPAQFPGPLRNQKTVSLKTLLVPYPQYGNLFQSWMSSRNERYDAIQVKLQKPFSKGYTFLVGYNWAKERDDQFFDDLATYKQQFSTIDSINPHHRVTVSGTYELPFGKGRPFLSQLHGLPNAILGGWQTVGTWYFSSGDYLRFGPMIASGDPALTNPTPQKWFDTSVFKVLPAYTPRTNPWQYPDARGPIFWDIQANVSKSFHITERIRTEFRMAAYNLTNRLNRADPDLVVTSSTFGQALRQSANTVGRQLEYGLKIVF